VPVYIPAPENTHLLVRLRAGEVSRELLRKLGRYAVNVRPAQLTALLPALEMQNGFAILLDAGKYDENCGLSLEGTGQDVWIC
jgi:CRISPR-associated endonuclease/helicase Cas3